MTKSLFARLLGAASALATAACVMAADNAPSYGQWKSVNIWGGGYVQDVILCPSEPKRCYAYIDMAGIYRSDDGGSNWRMLHGNLPTAEPSARDVRCLIVDPRDANKILVASGRPYGKDDMGRNTIEGVFKSDDGGSSFKQTLKAIFAGNNAYRAAGHVLARNPANPDEILAASIVNGLWRSSDNGETWQCLGLKDLYPSALLFDSSNPKMVWLCAQDWKLTNSFGKKIELKGALYRSDDGGASWNKLSDESPTEIVQDLSDAKRLIGIFKERCVKLSLDGGASWSDFSKGLSLAPDASQKLGGDSPYRFNGLAAGPGFLLAANAVGDFYRMDKGDGSWRKIERLGVDPNGWWGTVDPKDGWLHFGKALGSVIIDPANKDHWYFTDWFAIYQTFDAGAHWKTTVDGMAQTVPHDVIADPSNPRIVHLGNADIGYFRSSDGGLSFQKHRSNDIVWNVKRIAVARSLPSRLYGAATKEYGFCHQLFVSKDGGDHWEELPRTGLPEAATHNFHSLAVDPKNPDRVLVTANKPPKEGGGVYESLDAGRTWHWFGEGLPSEKSFFRNSLWLAGHEVAISGDGSMACLSGDRREIYFRGKDEKAWTLACSTKGNPYDLAADPFHDGTFIAGAFNEGVLRSEDGGRTWTKTWPASAGCVSFDPACENRAAASSEDGVLLSLDGGRSWQELDKSLPDRNLLNGSTFAGNRLIVTSRVSGSFWTEVPAPPKAGTKPLKPDAAKLQALSREFGKALRDELSLWFPRCIDQDGGFHYAFKRDWTLGEEKGKNLVFQTRMTWVSAFVSRKFPEFKSYSLHGLAFLRNKLWDKELGGFYWKLGPDGQPLSNGAKHAYGVAFGIYACSEVYKATRDPSALKLAQDAFAWLDKRAYDSVNGGYYESLDREGNPVLQAPAGKDGDQIGTPFGHKSMNTHIHLMEAFGSLYKQAPDPLLKKRLEELFAIVRDRILGEPGRLNLFFQPDWKPASTIDSYGHDVETAFLMLESAEALGEESSPKTLAAVRSLVDAPLQAGWDSVNGGFFNEGEPGKAASKTEKVWWVQAEALNALLLAHELFGDRSEIYWRSFLKEWDFTREFQIDKSYGGWYPEVEADGKPRKDSKGYEWKAAYHTARALLLVEERLDRLSEKAAKERR